MQRRDFFKNASLLGAAGLTVSLGSQSFGADARDFNTVNFPEKTGKTQPGWGDAQVEHFTSYYPDFADKILWIRKDNQVIAAYRTNPNQKYPYIYPLAGPISRVSVTSESAQPWPHHRSVFMGADRVNGGNYWQEGSDRGQILSQDLQLLSAEADTVVFSDRCLWKKPTDDPIIEDTRKYTLQWRNPDYYTLDLEFEMKMLVDVHIEKTNHGFFGVRVEQDLTPVCGGTLVNDQGVSGEANTFGKPAKWMAFYGKRRFNPEITEGVAVFCPPKEPFENCPWFTRDYGNISPMPFLWEEKGLSWKKDDVLKGTYRIVVFAGTPQDVDLNKLWEEVYA
ncbi:MAG: PmoA family protein [Planctomycetia bacterium]|nr:PmoA family protein [Planctomycetia bacterium]